MRAAVYREIARLPRLEAKALRQRYREAFGEEPRTTQKQQLIRRISWKLQALSQGDISEAARRRALQIAQDREAGIHLPSTMVPIVPTRRPSVDARLPVPGTELRRQYRDRVVVAKVLSDGFEYESRHYTSLSAVARAATGTRWNGWLFFGLTGELEMKYLRLRTPVSLGSRFGEWQVCWLGGMLFWGYRRVNDEIINDPAFIVE